MNRVPIEPIYKHFEGWQADITNIKDFGSVPDKMKVYIEYINRFLGIPVKYISNGPGRDQLILA